VGFDVGVGVTFDPVGCGLAHRAGLVLDLDAGQVERVEQQVDLAAGQAGVDLVAVSVQGHGRDRRDGALLAPQERPA
jgi:hypothetical protein